MNDSNESIFLARNHDGDFSIDDDSNFIDAEMPMASYEDNQITDQEFKYQYRKPRNSSFIKDDAIHSTTNHDFSSFNLHIPDKDNYKGQDNRVDKVYTVGCFDLFHHGHVMLINRMREIGKKVIVGVHDSRR